MRSVLNVAALALTFTAAQVQAASSSTASGIELEEVVVTGSRVITNGNDSPTPVTVVTTEELTAVRPGNLAESLNDMPVFAGSRTQNSNNGTGGAAGSPATSQNAGNVVNLRQMGLLRTLVLYDGHRAPPSTPDGYVDLDTIPQLLLKRVDVVTGGVSAVYGSDGISGVVNLVTDTTFQGIKGSLQAGRSVYGDGDTAAGGIAFGTNLFGGRAHLMGSFESRHANPLDSKLTRPWGRDVVTVQGSGTATFPYIMLRGVRQNNQTFGGRINSTLAQLGGATSAAASLFDKQFTSGGYLVPFVHGISGAAAGISNAQREIGGDGAFQSQQIRAGLDMNQGYARFDFDFTDDLHGYLSAAHTLNHSVSTGGYNAEANLVVSRDNAYLLQTYRDQLVAANRTSFTFGKIFTGLPRGGLETYARQTFINAGLDGSLGNGYKWDIALTQSKGSFDVRNNTARDEGRYAAAIDSVVSNGMPVCRAALTNPLYAGCVPMNIFGVNSESQESIAYFTRRLEWGTDLGMQDVSASITGAPFSTWAGPVNAALSAEWRKTYYEIISKTPPTTARADCTGITINCTANTSTYSSAVDSVPQVSTTVSEAAVEFGIPLLKDAPAAKSLDLNTAYRFAHYNRAGNANTWKVGVTWDPLDILTVRATRSRDFRAPSLDETFRAQTVNFTGFPDWITGNPVTVNNIRTEGGGNPDLKPELGDTLTYGVVVRPTSNFDIAVDAFDIKISDAIFLAQGNNPNIQNICYDSGGSSQYCQLIGRGLGIYDRNNPQAGSAANAINLYRQTFINLAQIETYGADVEAGFRTSIGSHPLSLRLLATYQPHVIYRLPSAPQIDYANSAFGTNAVQASPVWRVTGFVNFKPTDSLSVALQTRWRSSVNRTPEDDVEGTPPVKSVAFVNMNLSYQPKWDMGDLSFFLNIQNLFNTDPPAAGNYLNPTPGNFGEYLQGDDVLGRYYTVGVRFKL